MTLPEAILEASRFSGNSFVYESPNGWAPAKAIPLNPTFFKISHGKIYACIRNGSKARYSEHEAPAELQFLKENA